MNQKKWLIRSILCGYIVFIFCFQSIWIAERKEIHEIYDKQEKQPIFTVEVQQIQGNVTYRPEQTIQYMALSMIPYYGTNMTQMSLYEQMTESQRKNFWNVLLIVCRTNLYAEWEMQGYPKKMIFPVDKMSIDIENCGYYKTEAKEALLNDALIAQKATQGIIICFHNEKNQQQLYQNLKIPYFYLSAGQTRSFCQQNILFDAKNCKTDLQNANFMSWKRFEKNNYFAKINQDFEISLYGLEDLAFQRDNSDYVKKIIYRPLQKELSVSRFMQIFSLESPCFYIEEQGQDVVISCKGIGHGYGLSVNYVLHMVMEGMPYDQIITYFFQNAFLERKYGV